MTRPPGDGETPLPEAVEKAINSVVGESARVGAGESNRWHVALVELRAAIRAHARSSADALAVALEALEATVSKTGEASEWLDREGMRFYRETRIWPLFKSAPLEMHHELDDDARQAAWREWVTAQRDAAIDKARAALAAHRKGAGP